MIDALAAIFDKLKLTRRVAAWFTLYITWIALHKSFELADATKDWSADGVGIAAVIAAIMVPVSGLQAATLNFHHKGGGRVSDDS